MDILPLHKLPQILTKFLVDFLGESNRFGIAMKFRFFCTFQNLQKTPGTQGESGKCQTPLPNLSLSKLRLDLTTVGESG